jgi:hypothetical protein
MGIEAKVQAVSRMRGAVKLLEETFDTLGKAFEAALPADQTPIAAQMGKILEEKTAEQIFLNHLEAATTEVAPPNPDSYKALDQALTRLEEMNRVTGDVQKLLQIASAIADHTVDNRREVSSRTT